MNAVVVKASEGRAFQLGDMRMVVKEDGMRTRGALGIAEFEVPPQSHDVPPPHVHHGHEEGFYILEGELEFVVGMGAVRAGQGSLVMVPIGVAHSFNNLTDRPARFLGTFTPRRYLSYFEELSQLHQATGSPSLRQFAELMARYDTEVVS